MKYEGEKLDSDQYPTMGFLKWITYYRFEWGYSDLIDEIKDAWWTGGYGFLLKKERAGIFTLLLDTGGWSGNEDIIRAFSANQVFWSLCWHTSKRGGHYVFKVRIK